LVLNSGRLLACRPTSRAAIFVAAEAPWKRSRRQENATTTPDLSGEFTMILSRWTWLLRSPS
jgi:hypothetical protein